MWKRRRRGRKSSAGPRLWPQVLLWVLLAVETLWLAVFMASNGSPLPPLAEQWLTRPGTGAKRWTASEERRLQTREDELTEMKLRKLLEEKGSQGAEEPVPPAHTDK